MELKWDQLGEHLFETGVDHVALFPFDKATSAYSKGVAWNGITGVTKSPSGAEPTALWADNIKYLNLYSAEELAGTITAYTYPDEWKTLNGQKEIAPGVWVSQQSRGTFGLVYRTKIGNDTEGDSLGHKYHFVYGAQCSPSEEAASTKNDSPEATEFSWEFNTTPVSVTGADPTSILEFDTLSTDPDKLEVLLKIVYGSAEADARLPLPDEIASIMGEASDAVSFTMNTNISATEDLYGKVVSDLQNNIQINGNKITGTLKYQSSYTGFSSNIELQSGNFIALHFDVDPAATVTVTVTKPTVLDEDRIVVLRIADKDTQSITVEATKDGQTTTKVYDISGLTCLSA